MSFNNFIKRIICFSISSIMFANNSFAGRIIINNSSKSSQLKNEKKPAKNNTLFKLFEKWDNLTPEKKKYIISEIFGWGTAALNTFFIKKLYNALFLNQSTKASSITKNEQKQTTQTPTPSASPTPSLIPKPKQPTPPEPKYDSPFANLEWRNNNCYIDATLQILYEDKEFREYVNRQKENFEHNSTCKLSKENAETAYKSLYQIFEDMDKYKGQTVPYNEARENFEKVLGHIGSADANWEMFAKIYPYNACVICDNSETKKVEITGQDPTQINNLEINDLTTIEYEKDSLWFTCNATSKDDCRSLPMKLTFKNNKKFKLKGVVMYVPRHYNAYKTDENGQWYFIDDAGSKNEKYDEQPDFKAVYMDYNPKTKKCIYGAGVQLAYYQAVTT